MGQANFMKHISPQARLQASEAKGPDQAAMQAKQRMEYRYRQPFGGAMTMSEHEQSRRDYEAMGVMCKRKYRGGSTFNRGDGLF